MINKVVILGAGESGLGAARLAKVKGLNPFVSDLKQISPSRKEELVSLGIDFEEGKHTEEIILSAEKIIKSPGIPNHVPIIREAAAKGIPVISELEFAYEFTKAKMIAITGTNGKTTTTLLTYHLLKEAGLRVGLAGNVGFSLAKQVIEDNYDYYVVEVSSFQLDNMFEFKADVAMLLNITPDHLDRYNNDFEQYVDAKFRILQNVNPEDLFIYWDDDPVIKGRLKELSQEFKAHPVSIEHTVNCGAFLEPGGIRVKNEMEIRIPNDFLPLIGKHNVINSMMAVSCAHHLGLTENEIIEGLATFRNAPHRLEKVAAINGVHYVNDSKATNVNSVYYALDGLAPNIIWIAGGVDKGNDYSIIEELVKEKVSSLICLGVDNHPLTEFFSDRIHSIYETSDIGEAVMIAETLATPGDTVLLSPACASFDLFNNYEHRGDRFKEEVLNLKSENGHEKEVML